MLANTRSRFSNLTLAFLLALGLAVTWPVCPVRAQDNDINRTELNNFDQYLDDHPGVARQLQRNPSLINDPTFLSQHPDLQTFLNNHPGVREEIKENPRQFMNRERRFERNGGDISRAEAAKADQFLDSHPEIAEQLQKHPRLIDNPQYLQKHPELQEFLKNHPEVREDWREHPRAFMKRQRQYERHEGPEMRAARRRR
jgi:hypothetical protein